MANEFGSKLTTNGMEIGVGMGLIGGLTTSTNRADQDKLANFTGHGLPPASLFNERHGMIDPWMASYLETMTLPDDVGL